MKSDKLCIPCMEQRKLNNTMNSIKLENRMDTIFINSENSKTSDSHILLLNLTDKVNQKRSGKYIALSNLSIYYIQKNIKKSYKNKIKILAPTWNEEFELPNGSYSASDIQDCFEYINKSQTVTDNPSIVIYLNKIKNRITFMKTVKMCFIQKSLKQH